MTATLAHVRQRYTLLAICNECAHTVELDVDGLVGTLGSYQKAAAVYAVRVGIVCGTVGVA